MSRFSRYTTDIERGQDGAQIYWRALWAMQDDYICSMLAENALKGLAGAYQEGMTTEDNKAKFSRSGAGLWAREVVRISPLSILSPEAIEHIGYVIEKSMFPESMDGDE